MYLLILVNNRVPLPCTYKFVEYFQFEFAKTCLSFIWKKKNMSVFIQGITYEITCYNTGHSTTFTYKNFKIQSLFSALNSIKFIHVIYVSFALTELVYILSEPHNIELLVYNIAITILINCWLLYYPIHIDNKQLYLLFNTGFMFLVIVNYIPNLRL